MHEPEIEQKLDFNLIIKKIEKYITSDIGLYHVKNVTFFKNRERLYKEFKLVEDMSNLIVEKGRFFFHGSPELMYKISKAKINDFYIEGDDIYAVAATIEGILKCSRNSKGEKHKNLKNIIPYIPELENLAKKIKLSFSEKGEILDNGSPELRKIRKKLKNSKANIEKKLEKIISSLISDKISKEDIITMRNGRYVVPIVTGRWSQDNYILHDRSSTGSTLFVEPVSVLSLNNEISELLLSEKEEEKRIILNFCNEIYRHSEELIVTIDLSGKLDFIQARGLLINDDSYSIPEISDDNNYHIINGLHPFVSNPVPISLDIGKNESHIVISGANAGGKTVTLKIFGLFSLMFQSAIPLPCHPDSKIPIFDKILADIGDSQSIENNLSTFSAHIVTLSKILKNINSSKFSLVLLDELGGGSNPTQGSALACAILEELQKYNVISVITTHYESLIELASRLPKSNNCAVKFDIEKIKPLYFLEKGVSGISHSFKIAKLYGLNPEIIEMARKYMKDDELKLEKITEALELKEKELEKERRKLISNTKKMNKMKIHFKEEVELLKKKQEKVRLELQKEIEKKLDEKLKKIDEIVKLAKNDSEKMNSSSKRGKIKSIVEDIKNEIKVEKKEEYSIKGKKAEGFIGEKIIYIKSGLHGEIIEIRGNKRAKVQFESGISAEVKMADLIKGVEKLKEGIVKVNVRRDNNFSPEIDIRGKRAHEGVKIVEKYLDEALNLNIKEVRIIHGKGTMKLSEAISDFLNTLPYVENFRKGRWGEGDFGITVVKLK